MTGALRLFSVFHANLDFSAIPEPDLPRVIDRCYWPLLSLVEEERIPIGFEASGRTLARLAAEDPEWLKAYRALVERDLIEPVASGWAQLVAPLVPADVNADNLALGRAAYAELLERTPTTWFVGEQTWADGLADLYLDCGARRLVMEWNNPASQRRELRPLRGRPARVVGRSGRALPILWNDCVLFQKVQRVAHGQIPADDLWRTLSPWRGEGVPQAHCLYGGDVEIFDYRPGHPEPAGAERGVEMARLRALFAGLAREPGIGFRLPVHVHAEEGHGPLVTLASSADPLPCKKQPRYNPTRWAVSGRDGLGMNTACYRLRRDGRAARALGGRGADPRDLVELWRSDLRTRATEEKIDGFHRALGRASERCREELARCLPPLGEGDDAVLVNGSGAPWAGQPVAVPLVLEPGRLAAAEVAAIGGTGPLDCPAQLEVESRYRDGSVRRASAVLEPELAVGGRLRLRLCPVRERASEADGVPERPTTAKVSLSLLPHRGGAIEELVFPELGPAPLLGTVPHGTFDAIEYTPDFYSGHVLAVDDHARKTTDLSPAAIAWCHRGAVRDTVEARVETRLGLWRKR
ncbi:MAG: hypothetical protein MJE66_00550, partial [Proteobacteria bacterium]|nr:hypothetical protein [Pseudomonadota bacterium]